MKLRDTVEMMQSADYKERFKAEYYQLETRIYKLTGMVSSYEMGTLDFTPSCPLDLLEMQLNAMKVYAYALRQRAEIEGIEL